MKTICIAVEREVTLAEGVCPLPRGSCYWAHRTSGKCTYTDVDLTAEQFAERTGADIPDGPALQAFTNKLKDKIND